MCKMEMVIGILIVIAFLGLSENVQAQSEVIENDLGVVHFTQAPKTWTIDVPRNFNKVEVGVHGKGKDEINQYGGWAAYLEINGDYVWKFSRFDKARGGIIHDYIKGEEVLESTGRDKWLDVTSRVKAGKNTITYYHFTEGDGIGVKVRIYEGKQDLSTPASIAVPTPTPTSPATPPNNDDVDALPIPPFYVIGAAAIIAIFMVVGIVSRKRKGGNSESNKPKSPNEPQPPSEPPQPKQEHVKDKTISELTPTKPESGINITSAFGYKGAAIVHKIKVENPTSEPVSDIKIHLFVPPEVFLLKEQAKNISLLKPGESKTVTFEIRPTGECGDCEVSGIVTYYDYASRKTKEVDIPAKTLSIVCPLLKAREIDKAAWKDTVSRLIQAEESTKEIQIPAETLFNMASRVIEDMNMFMLEPEVTSSPQLFNGVARFYAGGVKDLKYAAQIEVVGGAKKSKLILKAWTEKEEALTGFYHGMLDEIEKRVQVKDYIDDSIVQQFYHIGDKIGAVVKDSVVQRSSISGGADAGKKCPSCGREVSEDERFCPGCGEELK